MTPLRSIPPGSKPVKKMLIRILMFFVARGMQSASKIDPDIHREIAVFPEGFTITMNILPHGHSIHFQKTQNRLRTLSTLPKPADLMISFKNIESAFMVFTAQMGTPQAYAEHRVSVKGDVTGAVIFTRCIKILQGYLFIAPINKRIMKRLPPMPFTKQIYRLYIYCIGIPFGK